MRNHVLLDRVITALDCISYIYGEMSAEIGTWYIYIYLVLQNINHSCCSIKYICICINIPIDHWHTIRPCTLIGVRCFVMVIMPVILGYNWCLFRRRSKKTSKLRVTGLVWGIHRWPVNSPHKGPVTRKFFSFDDVITWTLRRGCLIWS